MQLTTQFGTPLTTTLFLIAALASVIATELMSSTIIYQGDACSGTPLVVSVVDSVGCEAIDCSSFVTGSTTYSSIATCVDTERETYVANAFAGFSFLMIETYTKQCKVFMGANAYLASGECQVYDDTSDNLVIAKLNADGSASLEIYNDSSCSDTPFLGYMPNSETLSSHSCYKSYSVFYSGRGSSDGSSGSASDHQATTNVNAVGSTSNSLGFTGNSASFSGSSSLGLLTTESNNSAMDGSAVNAITIRDPSSAGEEENSDSGRKATVTVTPSESSGGINTGAIVGILVAYALLCGAACILCMDRMERLCRRLGLRR
ncbi:unnamed protein product [Phytophthora lilii]|uniref:Unnamed protein product n=1 Tax=Phytophthora lilii TaxID=2077276 RepID=A0A9W6WSJ5_9STRA|nr:unnamed protein product [Phytophthora lilii]